MIEVDGFYKENEKSRHVWTIFTKDNSCRRGEYAEEIDVVTDRKTVGAAKNLAQKALDKDFIDELRISRVFYRGETTPGVTMLLM